MTPKSQVENHKLAHKVLDTKNLLVFVVSVWLFFFFLGTLYLFVLAHHRTGWRKLGIQIFGGETKQENAGHANFAFKSKHQFQLALIINNYWMRLSVISWIIKHEGLIIHDIMRKPNSIIVLLYIFHIIRPKRSAILFLRKTLQGA